MNFEELDEQRTKADKKTRARRSALRQFRHRQLDQWATNLSKALMLYQKQSRKLFTRAERRLAAPLIVAERQALIRSLLQKPVGVAKQSRLKRQHRRQLDKELARVLPNFRIWRRFTRDYVRHVQKVLNLAVVSDMQLGLLGDFDVDLNDPLNHLPPFALSDVYLVNTDSAPVIEDRSMVVPMKGSMVNRFSFGHDGDVGVDSWFQLQRSVLTAQAVALGVSHTIPQTGRLQIHAVLQCRASRVFWSLSDSLGLSYGTLRVELRLFIHVVRRGKVISAVTNTLMFGGVEDSHGNPEPLTQLIPVDESLPYDLMGTTDETFQARDIVEIYVGSEVFISSDLNDMASHVDALVWWQLQQLSVATV